MHRRRFLRLLGLAPIAGVLSVTLGTGTAGDAPPPRWVTSRNPDTGDLQVEQLPPYYEDESFTSMVMRDPPPGLYRDILADNGAPTAQPYYFLRDGQLLTESEAAWVIAGPIGQSRDA